MNSIKTIIFFLIVAVLAGYAANSATRPNNQVRASTMVNWSSFSSKSLGVELDFPKAWTLNQSDIHQGRITLSSDPNAGLEALSSTGHITVDVESRNPKYLTPAEWYKEVLKNNVDAVSGPNYGTYRGYSTMSLQSNDMETTTHFYIFHGAWVTEIWYPTAQSAFASTYQTLLNSIRITMPTT